MRRKLVDRQAAFVRQTSVIGEPFRDDAIVLDAAGFRAVRPEVEVLAVELDDGLAGSLVLPVLRQSVAGEAWHDCDPVPREKRMYAYSTEEKSRTADARQVYLIKTR